MERSFNADGARPLIVVLKMFNKEKVILEHHELDDDMMNHADTSVDYDKSFKKHCLQGPLLWELNRNEEEKYFVETRKRFRLLNCHANMQLLTRSDQPAPVEDCLCECH